LSTDKFIERLNFRNVDDLILVLVTLVLGALALLGREDGQDVREIAVLGDGDTG
jgi:hypothetical protein